MSQIHVPSQSSPPPPVVPTSFETQDGTATPAANILIVNGFESPENNEQGITTKGGVVGTGIANEVDIILTNRVFSTVETTDTTPSTLLIFTPDAAGIYDLEIRIVVYDSTSIVGGTYYVDGAAQSDGVGGVTSIGTPTIDYDGDPSYDSSQVQVISSGGDIIVQVTGIAAHTARWSALLTYVFGGA